MKTRIELRESPDISVPIILSNGKPGFVKIRKILLNDNVNTSILKVNGMEIVTFEGLYVADPNGDSKITVEDARDFGLHFIKCHKYSLNDKPKEIMKYWSRVPGKWVNIDTGKSLVELIDKNFTGTVRDWYHTLTDSIDDTSHLSTYALSNDINIQVSDTVLTMLQCNMKFSCPEPQSKFHNTNLVGTIELSDRNRRINIYLRTNDELDHSIIQIDSEDNLFIKVLDLNIQ